MEQRPAEESEAVLLFAKLKRLLPTFEQVLDHFLDGRRVYRAAQTVGNSCMLDPAFNDWREAYDLLGISEDRDIRVVSGEDKLTLLLFVSHSRNDAIRDEPVIEIVLGLIDDERRI